jgi:hypothetical protein
MRALPEPCSANETFAAPPVEEGWGADYQRFIAYWWKLSHPVAKPKVGPPDPGILAALTRDIDEIEKLNPGVAAHLRTMLAENVRSLTLARSQPVVERPGNLRHFGPG